MSTSRYKTSLLEKRFPFLRKLFVDDEGGYCTLSVNDVDEVGIERGDEKLLEKKGTKDFYSWADGGYYNYTRYFAVWSDAEGEQVFELKSDSYSETGTGKSYVEHASTIEEQLFLNRINPDYIIECSQDDTDANGNGEVTHKWVIYIMNKKLTAAYHKKKIDEAAKKIKKEINSALGHRALINLFLLGK